MFSVARQQLDAHPLLECLSLTRVVPRRAIPFSTARSRWFDSRLRVVLRALWVSGPPLMGDTRTGWSASAPAPVLGDSSHLTHLTHPSSSSVRGIFPLEHPLVLLHPPDLLPHPAASCRREEVSGKDHLLTTISHSLGPSTYMLSEFHEAAGRDRSNQCTISLGTDSRCGRIGPVSHRHHATSHSHSLSHCLSLT